MLSLIHNQNDFWNKNPKNIFKYFVHGLMYYAHVVGEVLVLAF